MTIPVIVAVVAIALIIALIVYIVLLGTAKYDPSEKEKEDQYYMSSCNQKLFSLPENLDLYYEAK